MFKKLLILCLFTLTFSAEITDIQASQRTDGSGIVDIYYRLTDYSEIPSFTITAEISFDNGETFNSIMLKKDKLNFLSRYNCVLDILNVRL